MNIYMQLSYVGLYYVYRLWARSGTHVDELLHYSVHIVSAFYVREL